MVLDFLALLEMSKQGEGLMEYKELDTRKGIGPSHVSNPVM